MQMHDPAAIRQFTLAGKATVTLSSKATGERVTLKFTKVPDGHQRFFVNFMNGADNENDFAYLGLYDGRGFRLTGKSRVGPTAKPAVAATFFCSRVLDGGKLPSQLEVRHEGRCGKCNRKLTTPESIDRGIGPECWNQMGG